MKKILYALVLISVSPVFAWHYYSHGEQKELYPLKSFSRNINIAFFETSSGIRVGVGNKIVFKPKSKYCENKIIKKYNYKYYVENENIVLLVNDYKESIKISNEIYESGCVEFSHPDFLIFPKKRNMDPLFVPHQWNIYNFGQFYSKVDVDLNVYEAWLYSEGEGVKIALIDDSFDIKHEDLNEAFFGGYDVIYQSNDIQPSNRYEFHGTLCAGVIGARRNGKGIVGIAPKSQLYGVKLLISDQNGEPIPLYTTDIVRAFWQAKDVDVINCSWGTYNVADNVRLIIDKLAREGRNGKGIPIVFASGNDGMPQYYWENDESALDSVIAVGAVTNLGEHPLYSNYGPLLDFVAPSGGGTVSIATTYLRGSWGLANGYYGHPDYTYANDATGFNGTSAAAPQVTGVIALMLARDPDLSKDEIVAILKKTAKKVGDIPYYNGRNDFFGYGLVDAKSALEEVIRRKVLKEIANRSYPVAGYFIHYGSGPFEWVYVSASLHSVAKLEGMDEKGYLRWKMLSFDHVERNGSQIRFVSPLRKGGLEQRLSEKPWDIDGFFVHYDKGAYDWLYVPKIGTKVYKLEGLDYEKDFLWVDIEIKTQIKRKRAIFENS
jgi:subtilisin family serine protease